MFPLLLFARPPWRAPAAPAGSRVGRASAALLGLALAASACTASSNQAAPEPPPPVAVTVVSGTHHRALEVVPGTTVGDVLAKAKISPHDGQVLAARSRKAIGPNGDLAVVRFRGRSASTSAIVKQRGTLSVTDGADTVEPTTVVRRPLAPGGLPDAIQFVQFAGRPGVEEVSTGTRSKEIVFRRTIQAAEPAHRASGKVVALTFDDGPDGRYTPRILQTLKDKGVPATFCQIGISAQRNPDLSRAIVAAGHQLCNHTMDHVERLETKPQATIEAEIGNGRKALTTAAGKAPTFYRPPGGSLAPAVTAVAKANGESLLYWSIDTKDWQKPPAEAIVAATMAHLRPGAIIMLHDGGGDRSATVAALPAIIDQIRAQGYTFTLPVSMRSQVG